MIPRVRVKKTTFFTILFVFLIAALGIATFYSLEVPESNVDYRLGAEGAVFFGKAPITVAIADTYSKRGEGLSGLSMLPQGHGLWFVFDEADTHGIWMKDMLFPIDIIWLDSNFRVVGLSKNVSPGTYPQTFYPENPDRYVLEVNAGEADRLRVRIGAVARMELYGE